MADVETPPLELEAEKSASVLSAEASDTRRHLLERKEILEGQVEDLTERRDTTVRDLGRARQALIQVDRLLGTIDRIEKPRVHPHSGPKAKGKP